MLQPRVPPPPAAVSWRAGPAQAPQGALDLVRIRTPPRPGPENGTNPGSPEAVQALQQFERDPCCCRFQWRRFPVDIALWARG
eukprot:gene19196-biopygen5478